MPANATAPLAVELSLGIGERLAHLAGQRQRSAQWMAGEAIAQYVEREEKRAAFRQDGVRAWDAFQATGLHATQAEADAWLAQLESGQDTEPPASHV